MNQRKKILGLILGALCLLASALGLTLHPMGRKEVQELLRLFADIGYEQESTRAGELEVHFLDVGQSDATLILCGEDAMLIDAAEDAKGTAVQNYLQKRGIKTLKYLILTHTDADHIGGADVIITKFDVERIFLSDTPKESSAYRNLMEAMKSRGYTYETPRPGSRFELGTAEFTILAPVEEYEEANNASLGLLLRNGRNRFLFTGDAEEEAEEDILEYGLSIACDVFKAGHHGSRTSNTQAFLEAASPKAAVISCGEDNSYGHPHAGPLNSFRMAGIEVYRTDEQGTIVAVSDGNSITWNTPPSDSWKAGEPKTSSP